MKAPLKIALFYLVFGALWILLSDAVINALFVEAAPRAASQTIKGWFYVVVTTGLLYALVRYYFQQLVRKEAEKQAIFQSTMRAVHHILNNFLNNMMPFRPEAEEINAFDQHVVAEYDRVI